jgi:hypothetical protein
LRHSNRWTEAPKADAIYECEINKCVKGRDGSTIYNDHHKAAFPSIGSPFSVKVGRREKKAAVDSYHCECRGPEEPHEHYFVRWPGLVKGDRLIIRKSAKGKNLYYIRIEE